MSSSFSRQSFFQLKRLNPLSFRYILGNCLPLKWFHNFIDIYRVSGIINFMRGEASGIVDSLMHVFLFPFLLLLLFSWRENDEL